jgi:hypothetical protein
MRKNGVIKIFPVRRFPSKRKEKGWERKHSLQIKRQEENPMLLNNGITSDALEEESRHSRAGE